MGNPKEHALLLPPNGDAKSLLDALLKRHEIPFVAGPVHSDGLEEFDEAHGAAHHVEAGLPLLYDAVLEATGCPC